jgi:hypothetical protein
MNSLPIAVLSLLVASHGAAAQADQGAAQASAEPASPATPDADTPTPDIVVEGEVPKEQRRVCEMQTTTGSIMPKRVCRTVAQVEEDQRVARESLEIIKRDHDTRGFVELSRGNR